MKHVIRIRIVDLVDSTLPATFPEPGEISVVHKFHRYLDEKLSGLLCIDHCSIPVVKAEHFGDSYVISISCCCERQFIIVNRRVNRILKTPS